MSDWEWWDDSLTTAQQWERFFNFDALLNYGVDATGLEIEYVSFNPAGTGSAFNGYSDPTPSESLVAQHAYLQLMGGGTVSYTFEMGGAMFTTTSSISYDPGNNAVYATGVVYGYDTNTGAYEVFGKGGSLFTMFTEDTSGQLVVQRRNTYP